MLSRQYPDKAVRGFFITEQEPSAHQREAVAKISPQISVMSFSVYQHKLIDSGRYISDRKNYPFGSALDPFTQKPQIRDRYIPIGLAELPDKKISKSVDEIQTELKSGRIVALLGEFGAGKSMTMRQIFLNLSKDLLAARSSIFPVYLNLRDHNGQSDPSEALFRHCTRVGFEHDKQLVRAWRAGQTIVLLDGFDEISSPVYPGTINSLETVRRRTVTLVRNFIDQTPHGTGVMVAGRQHYFDSNSEMTRALGLPKDALMLSASDLTLDQVRELLSFREKKDSFPAWIPPRPLLVAHLASRDVLKDLDGKQFANISDVDRAAGWDHLIGVISNREARLGFEVDGTAVRMILERLASMARSTASGLGPLKFDELVNAFKMVSNDFPDQESFVLLQRLATLQVYEPDKNTRTFIDDDLADALRVGDVIRYVEWPIRNQHEHLLGIQTPLGNLGQEVLRHLFKDRDIAIGALKNALKKSVLIDDRLQVISADLVQLLLQMGESIDVDVALTSLFFPSLTMSGSTSAERVTLSDCIIQELDVTEISDITKLPLMYNCEIEVMSGVSGLDAFSQERLHGCNIGAFSDSSENSTAILSLPIDDLHRVILTILQKLFMKSGKGRRELAFYRGGLTENQRSLVPSALEKLQTESFAWKERHRGTILWSPNRSMADRVMKMLSAPSLSDDPLLKVKK